MWKSSSCLGAWLCGAVDLFSSEGPGTLLQFMESRVTWNTVIKKIVGSFRIVKMGSWVFQQERDPIHMTKFRVEWFSIHKCSSFVWKDQDFSCRFTYKGQSTALQIFFIFINLNYFHLD